jgi:hypothetical protein
MSNEEAPRATTILFSGYRQNGDKEAAIVNSLAMLANGYEKPLTVGTVKLYTAVLWDLDEQEIVRAFSRASEECKGFYPSPPTLREFSGRPVSGDPMAAEAKAELLKLLAGMRGPHGLMLKPIPGRILYGTEDDPKDAEGKRTFAPIRGESTHFPIARRTEAALVRLGWGNREAGIAVIADHPALKREKVSDGADHYRQSHLRASEEILKRWTEVYKEVQ